MNHIAWSAPRRVVLPATWDSSEKMLEVTLPEEFVGAGKSSGPRRKIKF